MYVAHVTIKNKSLLAPVYMRIPVSISLNFENLGLWSILLSTRGKKDAGVGNANRLKLAMYFPTREAASKDQDLPLGFRAHK